MPDNASNHLKSILDGMLKCASYPSDSAIIEENGGTEVQMAAIKEEQEAVEDRRRDLLTLFKNIARVMISPTVQFVDSRLAAALSNPDSTFQVRRLEGRSHGQQDAVRAGVQAGPCPEMWPVGLTGVRCLFNVPIV